MSRNETPEQTKGRVHPDDLDRFERDYWAPTAAGRPAQIDYRFIRPDGEVRWIRSITSPVGLPGESLHRYATTSEDITVRRQAEAALLSAEAAERANAAKSEFLSRMSHELRTPLNAVLGFAQLLELDELSREQISSVRHILGGGRHLLALIDDVLDISKIETDNLDLSLEPVPVWTLLTETVDSMMPQAVASGVTLLFGPHVGVEPAVSADRRRLRQVVLNLLSNAIKYNRSAGRVDVSCSVFDQSRVDIGVLDTGRGISPEDMHRLFTPSSGSAPGRRE